MDRVFDLCSFLDEIEEVRSRIRGGEDEPAPHLAEDPEGAMLVGTEREEEVRTRSAGEVVASRRTNEGVMFEDWPVAFSVDEGAVESMLLSRIRFGSLKMFDCLTSYTRIDEFES